jgi:hypothetical protein
MVETSYPNETNPIEPGYHKIPRTESVYWTDPRLARITRLRLVTDNSFPMWDVSYCDGVLVDETPCRVSLPFSQLRKGHLWTDLKNYSEVDCVSLNKLKVWESISKLW